VTRRIRPRLPKWSTLNQTAADLRAWLAVRGAVPVPELFVNAEGDAMSRAGFEYILDKHVCVATKSCSSLSGRSVSPHQLRHYLPFRTMSGDGEPLAIWPGDSRSRRGKPQRIARHSLVFSTDCSGRRGVGRRVCSDQAFPPAGMSWQVLSPSWQVSLRDKSGWFQHVRDRATMR
jgi:hypothetical protein